MLIAFGKGGRSSLNQESEVLPCMRGRRTVQAVCAGALVQVLR